MEKVLSQGEMDALFRAARSPTGTGTAEDGTDASGSIGPSKVARGTPVRLADTVQLLLDANHATQVHAEGCGIA